MRCLCRCARSLKYRLKIIKLSISLIASSAHLEDGSDRFLFDLADSRSRHVISCDAGKRRKEPAIAESTLADVTSAQTVGADENLGLALVPDIQFAKSEYFLDRF